jgi:hypothetical protein
MKCHDCRTTRSIQLGGTTLCSIVIPFCYLVIPRLDRGIWVFRLAIYNVLVIVWLRVKIILRHVLKHRRMIIRYHGASIV